MRPLLSRLPSFVLIALAIVLLPPCDAAGAPPATLNYDGNLTSAEGRPLSSGHYDFRFALYTSPTGGVPIWTETHARVQVNNGSFHVVLGKGSPGVTLDLPFDQQYYLGVSVDVDPELSPRVELMPTPYSFHSRMADRVADTSVTTTHIAPGAVTDEKIRSVSWSKITGVNGSAGVPSAVWSLKGNSNSNPNLDFLGTTDGADLVFRTNNEPRLSIRSGGAGEFLSDFYANGSITSRPSSSSGAFLFGDQSVGLERPGSSSDLRLFGPPFGSFFFEGGNVGIGTPSPVSKLEVNGDASVRQGFTVYGITRLTHDASSAGPGSGALIVSGGAGIGENLNVQGAARVAGLATVGGTFHVSGTTTLEDTTESTSSETGALAVRGGVGVEKSLTVARDLEVKGVSTFQGQLEVRGGSEFATLAVTGDASVGGRLTSTEGITNNGSSRMNGQVVINTNLDERGDRLQPDAYPLLIQGSSQGIMLKLTGADAGTPNGNNNFLSFVGTTTNRLHGHIAGLTATELHADEYYKWEQGSLIAQQTLADLHFAKAIGQTLASALSTTTCLGFGACQTLPIVSFIIASVSEMALTGAEVVITAGDLLYWRQTMDNSVLNGGVTYSSSAADYAEWLPKADLAERLYPGDVVGVRSGRVSKATDGAEMLMVVSTNPLVLGNTPPQGRESDYVKVAFMGQVPVKVFGKVEPSNYIVASGNGNGFGVARRASDLSAPDYPNIVGIAWSGSDATHMGYVTVAVGLDRNSIARLAIRQDTELRAQASEIDGLRRQLQQTHTALARLVPGFGAAMAGTTATVSTPASAPLPLRTLDAPAPRPSASSDGEAIGPGHTHSAANHPGGLVSRADLEQGVDEAVDHLRRAGATVENNAFLRQLTQPGFRDKFIADIQARVNQQPSQSR